MEGVARLFVAAPLTDDARQALSASIRAAVPGGLPGRVVPPQNWHVTLRFLGDVGAPESDRLVAALDAADLGGSFPITWDRLGAFPRPGKAAVLWVGAERGRRELELLAAAVEDAAVAGGFPPEDRPFRAHLTLSRVRPPRDVTSLLDEAGTTRVAAVVDRAVLYRSHLGPGGARYEEIEEFPLG